MPTQDAVHAAQQHLGKVFRNLTGQRESRVEEGHLMSGDEYMLLSIPPKYAVSQVVGFIKGMSAIRLVSDLPISL